MVRILIAMRAASLRNARRSRFGTVALVGGGVVGLATAVSTLLLGATADGPPSGGADRIALVTLTWMAGRVGFAAFSGGDPAVPLDLFRIVPVPRRVLARGLLVLGLLDPSMPFLAIAFASVAVYGFRLGALPGVLGLLGAAATLVATSLLATIVAASVPTGSRRRQDAGVLLSAGAISVVVMLGTLIGPLLSLLAQGRPVVLAVVLRALPSGWAADAVADTATGHALAGLLPLAGVLAACVALAAVWPRVLSARLLAQAGSSRRAHGRAPRRLVLRSATGAVVARELRLWIRDPNRAAFLLIAAVVGLGTCAVPLLSRGTALLLPFAGCGTSLIAGAVAGNLYGFDGRSVAIVLGAAAERADVRGRQLAWLLLVGPYSAALTLAGVLLAHESWAAPWALGLLPALLGGAAGVAPLLSVTAPQPLDGNGSPGPTWVALAYAAIALIAVSTAPALALLVAGASTREGALSWLGVPVGIASGAAATVLLGGLAARRLARRGPELYSSLADAGVRG